MFFLESLETSAVIEEYWCTRAPPAEQHEHLIQGDETVARSGFHVRAIGFLFAVAWRTSSFNNLSTKINSY